MVPDPVPAETLDLGEDAEWRDGNRIAFARIGIESLEELTRLFAGLGLGERQEAAIYDVARRGSERTSTVLEEGSDLAARLKLVVARLQAAS